MRRYLILSIPFSLRRYLILGVLLYLSFLTTWHFYRQEPPGQSLSVDNVLSLSQNAGVLVRATALELEELLRKPFKIWDFASMADRIVKFAVLAETTVAEKTVDEGIILSLLEKHFPWWLPQPSTYMPWHRRPKPDLHDTGIVICAGSRNKIYAIHLIRILRDVLHSKLPIEIAYAGDEDLSFVDRRDLMALDHDIRLVNLLDHFDERVGSLRDGGYALKPFSILASRFRRVIMADADAIFLRAPDRLFVTEPGLVETGTYFWHDRAFGSVKNRFHRKQWIQSLLDEREPSSSLTQTLFWTHSLSEQQDSAVVCMDKGRPKVFTSLLFSVWMNLKRVRDEVTYQYTWGDKESFWLAAELTQTPYHFNPWYASCLGILRSNDTVCGTQAGQLDHRGDLLWYNGAIRHNKYVRSRELVNITHWMGGKQNSNTLGQWSIHANSMWCLRGDHLTSVASLGIWSDVQKMLKVAKEVDDRYLPIGRS